MKRLRVVIGVAVLLLVAGGAVAAWAHYRDRVSSDDANVDGHVSAIAPKIGGDVVEVLVKDNQPVNAGDVLVRIDPRDFQAKVNQAKEAAIRKAALDGAQSRVSQAKAQVEMSVANRQQVAIRTADVGGASAAVTAARANLEAAELQLSYTTIAAPASGVVTQKSVEVGQ